MATIKSFTDLSQSKTLSKILPLESADKHWIILDGAINRARVYDEFDLREFNFDKNTLREYIPCWSLAALLSVLPNGIVMNKDSQNGRYHFSSKYIGTYVTADNPVDACYKLILKLNELNLL